METALQTSQTNPGTELAVFLESFVLLTGRVLNYSGWGRVTVEDPRKPLPVNECCGVAVPDAPKPDSPAFLRVGVFKGTLKFSLDMHPAFPAVFLFNRHLFLCSDQGQSESSSPGPLSDMPGQTHER